MDDSDKKNSTSLDYSPVIKMPEPLNRVQRQQALLKSLGISEDQFEILEIQDDPATGESYIIAKVSPELAKASDKLATTPKLHDPDETSIHPAIEIKGGKKVGIVNVGNASLEKAKQWVKSERKRRSKPKNNEVDIT